MDPGSALLVIALVLFTFSLVGILFIIFRGVILWFWRVNTMVNLLEKLVDQNTDIIALLEMSLGIDPNANSVETAAIAQRVANNLNETID